VDLIKCTLCREQGTSPDVAACLASNCARALGRGAVVSTQSVLRGYTVRVSVKIIPPEEAAARRKLVAEAIVRATKGTTTEP
jgi:hypothetical protein